ncbi:MAG TPA: hypothetical protein VGH87_01170 [Polyangiaceae bacterium]|jgi:hypothetical protein
MTWFESLFGFPETTYEETRARFVFEGDELRSIANGRSFAAGRFTTPSLRELRAVTSAKRGSGRVRISHEVVGDALELHALAENVGALFQVASQLNCLEFAGPEEIPENGVTDYASDPTQGPACSLAAAAATVVRNYFVDVDGARGQTASRQLNLLAGIQSRIGDSLIDVRNGYTFSDEARLALAANAIAKHDRDELMGDLRIGLHEDVEVTFARRFEPPSRPQRVSQAFCSALSCGYASGSLAAWQPIATLVLDAAYEATLLAAAARGTKRVWLTLLGAGAFGNELAWIENAITRAASRADGHDLEVIVAHFRRRHF